MSRRRRSKARPQRRVPLRVAAIAAAGLALMLSMTFGELWSAVAFFMVGGGFMLVGNVGAQSLIQHAVDSRVRARVLSLFIVFAYGLPAFGAAIMGGIASHAGLRVTIGCGALLMVLVWWAVGNGRTAINKNGGEVVKHPDHETE